MAQDRIKRLEPPRDSLVSDLKINADASLPEIKEELDPEGGWSELVTIAATSKGPIHKFIEKHSILQRIFREASSLMTSTSGRSY
jgi:hypothetical protein